MDQQKAAEELAIIRQLMECPVQLSTRSGAAGVFAGAVALVGLWADGAIWRSLPSRQATLVEMLLWGGVFLAALAGTLVLTRRRERKLNLPFWTAARNREAASDLRAFPHRHRPDTGDPCAMVPGGGRSGA